jgi:hypothetical protein
MNLQSVKLYTIMQLNAQENHALLINSCQSILLQLAL